MSAARATFSLERALELEREQRHDLLGFVGAVLENLGDEGRYFHFGVTSYDIEDPALALLMSQAADLIRKDVDALCEAIRDRAREHKWTPMMGRTHGIHAEPITFGHWCLAYVEMLGRDRSRLGNAVNRGDECPLGSGALAGTPLPIDRDALAKSLGFARATRNSLDAVSDRDFAAEYLFAAVMLLSHLSRMAEDLIFFSSDEAGYVELPDAMATGSSRMPQKKNPDILELTRGHAARAIGELTGLLALLKGLPLAYDKDLQLDKEPLFRIRRVIALVLPAIAAIIDGLQLNRERMRAAASSDLLVATSYADKLAAKGMPFREAHEIVGNAIRNGTLDELAESLK